MPDWTVLGGPAIPVVEQSSDEGVTIPAMTAYIVQPGDGYVVQGGPAMAVKVITDPNYPRAGGAAIPVSVAAPGAVQVAPYPVIPIYYLNPVSVAPVTPTPSTPTFAAGQAMGPLGLTYSGDF